MEIALFIYTVHREINFYREKKERSLIMREVPGSMHGFFGYLFVHLGVWISF